jgi:hypothetical protein
MAVLADAAPCGPVPGRTRKRQWTVPLTAVQQAAAAVSAYPCRSVRVPCRSRGCPPCRPPAGCGCPQAASTVHTSGPEVSAGCAELARTPGHVRGTGHPGRVRWTSGLRPGPGRTPPSAADTAAAPLSRAGHVAVAGGRPSMHARRPRQWTPTARMQCPRRQHNLDAGGCPDQGVRRTACRRSLRTLRHCPRCVRHCGRLAMVSGRLVSTADTAAACGISAATGSGRRTGGR